MTDAAADLVPPAPTSDAAPPDDVEVSGVPTTERVHPEIEYLAPVRAILEVVPLDHVLFAIRAEHDRRIFPGTSEVLARS